MTSQFKKLFTILIFLSAFTDVLAQSKNALKLITYRDNERILLRWAPSNSSDWLELNRFGYTLERYTLTRDSVRLYPPEFIKISESFKPAVLQEWVTISRDNDYAALVAQSIYGEQVNINADNSGVIELMRKSREQDMRYSFVLIASDQSFEVAKLAGLGFEDKSISDGESYLYKLYGNFRNQASDTVFTIADTRESAPLPTIKDIEIASENSLVTLRWNTEYYKSVYSSYIIEKSFDGILFNPIQDIPSISTSPDKNQASKWMIKVDSLEDTGIPFYYRIRGKNPFGMVGPPSEVLTVRGEEEFKISIGITEANTANNGINILWDINTDKPEKIDYLIIQKSFDTHEYITIDTLDGMANSYLDKKPYSSNYYKVAAIGVDGYKAESHPYFIQPEDSIPPCIPSALNGICDTTGIVLLSWNKVKDNDLAGYRVYRSRVKEGEYRQVTIAATSDTIFTDSVNLNTLSKKMFYRIQAVDHRGNRSALSKPKFIKLSDIIAPSPPRIKEYKLDNTKVKISWTNSPSKDVKSTFIYRESKQLKVLLSEIPNTSSITNFVDSSSVTGMMTYYMIAVDSSGNESISSNRVQVFKPKNNWDKTLEVKAAVDRKEKSIHLKWESKSTGKIIKIYRGIEKEPVTLYKVLDSNKGEWVDKKLVINTNYVYQVFLTDIMVNKTLISDKIEVLY